MTLSGKNSEQGNFHLTSMNYASVSAITVGVVALGWYCSTIYPEIRNFKKKPDQTATPATEYTPTEQMKKTEVEPEMTKLLVQNSVETLCEPDQEPTSVSEHDKLQEETSSQHSDLCKSDGNYTQATELTGSFIILNTKEPHIDTIPIKVDHIQLEPDEYYDLTEEERLKLSDIRTGKLEKLELERKLKMLQWKREQERQVAQREAILFEKLRHVPEQIKNLNIATK
jgi:hypothetical protein